MKVLVAMDSFKGSLSSMEANQSIAEGFDRTGMDFVVETVPVADGGEGTVEALVYATGGRFVEKVITGPLGEKVKGRYGILGGGTAAVVEVAEACGLPLVSVEQRNPLYTTSYGVGELILDAIDNGCKEVIIGLGGSSTNDAGVGMLQALGFQFFNQEVLSVGFGGVELKNINKVKASSVPEKVRATRFRVACDVHNPLYGTNGAAYIFGPQKGATPEVVEELDQGLRRFADVVLEQFGIDLQGISGAGAAGGLGAAFAGFLQAELESGVELILGLTRLEEKLNGVNLVITGEGKLDGQTSMGKAPAGIAQMAKKHGIPVIALAGDVSEGKPSLYESGIAAYFTVVGGPVDLNVAMSPEVASGNLRRTAEQLGRVLGLVDGFGGK
nr:glycerate kinase [Bacillus sp. FJAT-29814]